MSSVLLVVALVGAGCGTDDGTPDAGTTADTAGGGGDTADINIDIDFTDSNTDIDIGGGGDSVGGKDGGVGADCTQPEDCAGVSLDTCEVAACVAGKCKAVTAPSGTSCDDGKVCTQNDVCNDAGVCAGSIQCEDKGPCLNPICTPQGDCGFTNVPPGLNKPCDDGNACTVEDKCAFGKCQGSEQPLKACEDDNSCTEDSCDSEKGCVHTPSDKGKACTKGDLCVSSPTCDGQGECKGGTPVTCDDGKVCTKDACDSEKGCVFSTKQDGVVCDDGSKCTDNDECIAGICKGTTIAAAIPSSACIKVACDPQTGAVSQSNMPDATSCDDGDPCTQQDACTAGKCKGKALVCNDSNPCTSDTCDPTTGNCKSAPTKNGDPCSDGNACTSKDACIDGKCVGEDYTVSKACEDNNPCTNDGCAPQTGCFAVPKNSGPCDDGDKCTEQDTCVTGKCVGKAKVCNDNNPCTNDACNKATGECTSTPFDGPCNDGNNCTANDTCAGGKCAGKDKDCNDNNPCTNDVCDTIAGCKNLPKLGGTACDDGVGCTTGDKCDGGQCVGKNDCVACTTDTQCAPLNDGNVCTGTVKCVDSPKGKVCDVDKKTIIQCPGPQDPACGTALCDGATGKCSIKFQPEGTSCTSANKCIEQTGCSKDGKCIGQPVDCDDDNDCTVDSCEPSKGCVHTAKPDDEQCDDGNQCTPDEKCAGGACVASKNLCACKGDSECTKWDDGDLCNGLFACIAGFCAKKPNSAVTCDPSKDACKVNACDKTKGSCALAPKKDGTTCDDGDKCSIQEVCTGGVCKSNAQIDCGDNNPCTFDVCDKVFGCFNAPVGAGGPCNDGNGCTVNDKCTSDGKCAGTKLDCNDDNPCTIDVCDAKNGKCTALLENGIKCDDGDPCTADDTCTDGVCKASQLKCDDGNPCTVDGCDGKGGCKNVLEPNKDCNDSDACTTLDRCGLDGKCKGKPKDCSDGNACTTEACENGVCVVSPAIDQPCDDGNACTEKDRCDKKGDCIADVVNCDDGNPCTKIAGPCSTVNGCTVVPDDGKSCNDGSLCTIADKCSGGACNGIKLPCDDGNVCTNDSCDPKKGCVNAQNTCDDGNDCTFDKCDAKKGCLSTELDGFQPCDDGDKCTEKGVCKGTKCELSLVVCNDKEACTLDKCDSEKGCVFLPNEDTTTVCDDDNVCTDDHCDGKGKCVGVDKDCDDGNPCTQDSCNKLKGCVTDDLKDGTPCDDGDACSEKTVCQGGFCSGGNYDKCGACPNGLDSDCAIFDDNDLCNGKFVCKKKNPSDKSGLCYPQPDKVVCDTTSDTPCIKNLCDPTSGTCGKKELVNGSNCDDGVPCTVGDTCQNGACKSGAPADCSGVSNACNDAGCIIDPTQPKGYGCVPLPKAGTIACDADGSGCTAQDSCDNGVCKAGEPVDCSAVAKECELAACVKDGANGFTCKITPMKDGSICDDGQLCTVGDSCKAGKCQAGPGTYDCKDEVDGICAIPTCDKAQNAGLGGCIGKPQNEGKVCDADDNGCTVNDICVQGFCVPGAPVNCIKETTSCTKGACKSTGAQSYECVAAPVNESKPCEADNNGCTLDDHCSNGKCVPGKMKDCSALDSNGGCLIGACEPLSASQGKCVAKTADVGQPCNADDNGCTKGDACNKDGACSPGPAVNCLAQASSCSIGACNSTGKDSYKCIGDPKKDGTKCDADGDGCTVDDVCKNGTCEVGAAPDCSKEDKSVCVIGGCTNKGSNLYICEPYAKKDGETCDADKNGCTVNDACFKGFCEAGKLETCKDNQSLCASAACEDKGGTSFQCKVTAVESYPPFTEDVICDPKAKAGEKGACPANYNCSVGKDGDTEGTCTPKVTVSCTDGDSCTVADVCVDGKCKGGVPPDCNDNKPCTLDFCQKGDCKHQPIEGCASCLKEEFDDNELPGWVQSFSDKSFKVEFINEGPESAPSWVYSVTWDGSGLAKDPEVGDPPSTLRLVNSKLYLDANKTQTLVLRARGDMEDDACLRVFIDEATEVWSYCGQFQGDEKYLGKYINVDLSKYAGRTIDVDIRFSAVVKKASKGSMIIDSVEVAGNCGPACLGESFEGTDLTLTGVETPLALRRPQPWRFESTASTYLSWILTDKSGKSGVGSVVATHAGKPTSGKAETAKMVLPALTPVAGSKFSFAYKATDIGEAGCTKGDKLVVSVAGNDVFQRCDEQKEWTIHTVDMTPYAGKTVDVIFTVTSAATDAAKGTFQVDDISMSGKCSWLCFNENFDASAKLDNYFATGSLTEEGVATKFKVEGGQSVANSKPYSMLIQGDDKIPAKSQAYIAPNLQNTPRIHAPVAGAALTLMINAVVNPDLCPPADLPPDQQVLEYPLAIGMAEQLAGGKLDMVLGAPICKSSSGWEKVTVQLDKKHMAKWVTPMIRAERLAKLKTMTVYVDDVQMICK